MDALLRLLLNLVLLLCPCSMVRMHLAAKRVLSEYKLTREAFMWLLGEIEQRFYLAQSHSGDCVGTVAAQSLGEPTTQVGARCGSAGARRKKAGTQLGVARVDYACGRDGDVWCGCAWTLTRGVASAAAGLFFASRYLDKEESPQYDVSAPCFSPLGCHCR